MRPSDCKRCGLQDWGFGGDPIYLAYQKFQDQFLLSPVRTEDPSEANLFWIPLNLYSYSGGVPRHCCTGAPNVLAPHSWPCPCAAGLS